MTKKFLVFSAMVFSVLIMAQDNIKFQELPYKDLLAKAKKEKKIVFIDAFASWCGPCKMMAKNIFTKKTVADYYNANFINAGFDMEKGEGLEIAQKFGVRSYPTYLFINGDGELITKNYGYMEEEMFVTLGKEANAPNNKAGTMKDRFAKGESDPEFLIKVMRLNSNSDFEFAKAASERYFKTKKTKTLTQDEVGFLLYFLKSPKDYNYSYFKDHATEIQKFLPEQNYKDFDNQIRIGDLLENSLDKEKGTFKDDLFLSQAIPLVGKDEAEKAMNRTKLALYSSTQNYPEFEKAALAYYRNPDLFDTKELLQTAFVFSEKIKTPASLKQAQVWAEKSVMAGETAENTFILARLLLLNGNREMAKAYAEMSKNLAQQQGQDASKADSLIKEIK